MKVTLPGVGLNRGVGLHRATSSDTSFLTKSQTDSFGLGSRSWNRHMIATSYYYKITIADEVVGGLVVVRSDWDRFQVARIWVDPAHQGQGIGSRALALAEARFPQATLWTVDVQAWRRRCHDFFTRNGYQRTGRQATGRQAAGRQAAGRQEPDTVRYQKSRRGLLHLRSLP